MTHTITFSSLEALRIFGSMAEGMEEVQRDDENFERADSLDRIARIVWAIAEDAKPLSATLENRDAQTARDALENCLDIASGDDEDADEDRIFLRNDEVTITSDTTGGGIEAMGCREALEVAAAALFAAAAQTDTASPDGDRLRQALSAVEAMIAQRGCESLDRIVFGEEREGLLTEIMDCVIYG